MILEGKGAAPSPSRFFRIPKKIGKMERIFEILALPSRLRTSNESNIGEFNEVLAARNNSMLEIYFA